MISERDKDRRAYKTVSLIILATLSFTDSLSVLPDLSFQCSSHKLTSGASPQVRGADLYSGGVLPLSIPVVTSASASPQMRPLLLCFERQQQTLRFSSTLALMLTSPQCLELKACIFDPLLTSAIPIVVLCVYRHF